ncbi:hypothetical protein D1818_17005 [Aquimarina sp. BL5]|uniref:hypothetical protein n=1 Tax=Aquimarina sp. BL5 TaxID=1714860 RepID=UPI000E475894|nr:hypothetical protein [Aquimarina sp. BL5]AXT52454.1 hypothetical protein D1818_17005 [Aquimarina sp. BL5]RKN03296.1 hypothetical protein D7036_14340 [Aquimarina sp. BL5]
MKSTKNLITTLFICLAITFGFAQDDDSGVSNIQEFTPSKLLKKGQWDIKFFNSIYTQTERTDAGSKSVTIDRQTFFTNTTEIFTGVSKNSRVNVGAIFQVRSNSLAGQGALDVFSFQDNGNDRRSGLTTIAPAVRIQPFRSLATFSFTTSLIIPVFEDAPDTVADNVDSFLDQRSFAWETKFFYDRTFGGNKWQLFTEVDFKFNFGDNRENVAPDENSSERFAGNSLFLPISAFLSYFPTSKSTVFVNAQQAFLIGIDNPQGPGQDNFSQNGTQLGFGGKYQLTKVLNIEASFGKFVRGDNFQGLGQTFSLGLRALF